MPWTCRNESNPRHQPQTKPTPPHQIIEDFVFYWAHRTLHHPMLYARVHKLHHKYKAPFSVTATFATSTEFVVSVRVVVLGSGVRLFGG